MKFKKHVWKVEKFGETHFFTVKDSDGLLTKWSVRNCENPKRELWIGLVDAWSYTEKYNLMKKFYTWDYELAREKARSTSEYADIEKEKERLMKEHK